MSQRIKRRLLKAAVSDFTTLRFLCGLCGLLSVLCFFLSNPADKYYVVVQSHLPLPIGVALFTVYGVARMLSACNRCVRRTFDSAIGAAGILLWTFTLLSFTHGKETFDVHPWLLSMLVASEIWLASIPGRNR